MSKDRSAGRPPDRSDRNKGDSSRGDRAAPRPDTRRALARHGAQRSTDDQREWVAESEYRRADDGERPELDDEQQMAREARREERRRRRDELEAEARAAIERGGRGGAKSSPPPRQRQPLRTRRSHVDPEQALITALGKRDGRKAYASLVDASDALDQERFEDARLALTPIVRRVSNVAEVYELLGLALYRLRRWDEAAEALETYRSLTGSAEEHPVLADCYRALDRHADVEALWDELREASPSGAIVTEGRIVTASARADNGDFEGAIRLLEKGWRSPKRPKEHHLRRAYALADLYERAGASTKARDLFGWIARNDDGFGDAADRAASR